jgi:glycosyltransferase involved in cell wall biosynthesis
VIIHSPALLEKKGHLNPHTEYVPNGVEYDAYASPRYEPADIRSIPRPRIGYTGFLKRQLDWPVILRLVERRPDWSFVFVGPASPHDEVRRALDELSKRENAHILGGKSVLELPAYPQHFDVCLMPYRADPYTRYIYPLKLHEFLASGRPVVATHIRSLDEFADLITLVDDADDWPPAIESALAPGEAAAGRREARQEVARLHDWDRLVHRIAIAMARRLSSDLAGEIESLGPAGGIRA